MGAYTGGGAIGAVAPGDRVSKKFDIIKININYFSLRIFDVTFWNI